MIQVYFKGCYVTTIKGESSGGILKVLHGLSDYAESPQIGKMAGIKSPSAHINKLKKLHNIQIEVDTTNKARHRFKLKQGYELK